MNEKSNRLVSIIIVTIGIKDYLWRLLDSIESQSYSKVEIIIIDNSGNQVFSHQISRSYPTIKLYSSQKNLFYCEALNKGIEMSKGDFLLCLNDDVILDKRFIAEALRGFSLGTKVGMVSGKILRQDGKTIDSTGLFLSPWRTVKERGYGLKDRGQFEREEYIFGVNGAVAFYRREMLEQIKTDSPRLCTQERGSEYFDSDFRFFYEDLDIAWRAQRLGWKGYYIPSAIAYHVRGGSFRPTAGIGKPFARRYLSDELHLDLIKNRYLCIIKDESCPDFLLHLPSVFLYDFVMWGYILFFKPQLIKHFCRLIPFLVDKITTRKFNKK